MMAKWKTDDSYANLYNIAHYEGLTTDEKESADDMHTYICEKTYKKIARLWNGVSDTTTTRYNKLWVKEKSLVVCINC
jgi:hypothetical protein